MAGKQVELKPNSDLHVADVELPSTCLHLHPTPISTSTDLWVVLGVDGDHGKAPSTVE